MRVKRSGGLVVLLENDQFVFHNYLRRRTFTAAPTALEIIRRLHAWTDLEALAALLPGYSRASIDRSIDALIEFGAILVEGSDAADLDDEFGKTWMWGPLAAAYHFSTQDCAFLAGEDAEQLIRDQAKWHPSPPLYAMNTRPSSDVSVSIRGDYDEPFLTMSRRRTNRFMLDEPIALRHLSDCFLFSLAITAIIEDPEAGDLPLKMTPSGGGRNPYEGYVCARNVEGLTPGTYHYSAIEGTFGVVRDAPPPAFTAMLAGQQWADSAAAVVFLVANFERPMWKYHHAAAYRVTILEAGHIAQNMMLVATKHGMAANPTCALSQDVVEETLGVGALTQSVVYALVLGVPAPASNSAPR